MYRWALEWAATPSSAQRVAIFDCYFVRKRIPTRKRFVLKKLMP